jgi:4-amino-4-deoxy-L-arabinose transferase-like glycosyltransferase
MEVTMPEATRAYLYRIVLAALPILTAYGIIAEIDAALYSALAAAILSTSLAVANTSTT